MSKARGCTSGRTISPDDLTVKDRARFEAFLPEHLAPDRCHDWLGGSYPRGYGSFWLKGESHRAHRVAYVLASNEPLPSDALVCHRCDRPPCCNPAHLFLGSASTNTQEAFDRGLAPVCPPPTRRGEEAANHKLVEEDVIALREMIRTGGYGARRIAEHFGISVPLVRYIGVGKAWAHVPGALTPEEYRSAIPIGRPPQRR